MSQVAKHSTVVSFSSVLPVTIYYFTYTKLVNEQVTNNDLFTIFVRKFEDFLKVTAQIMNGFSNPIKFLVAIYILTL